MSRRDHRATKKRRRPPRPTALGVIGELLITAGLFVLLFVVCELYRTNLGVNRVPQVYLATMSEMFHAHYQSVFNDNGPDSSVPEHSDDAWGLLYVPRFGAD